MPDPATIQNLLTDGYAVLPGVAGVERSDRARRRIWAEIGREGLAPDRLSEYAHVSFTPGLRRHPDVMGLVQNPDVEAALRELLDVDAMDPDPGQLALRFPQEPGDDAARREAFENGGAMAQYHIDGVPAAGNGVPAGEVHNFAVLVGVLLNDQPGPYRGNFRAHPGSHREMAAFFREHGTDGLAEAGTPMVATAGPAQVVGRAGDVIVANHLVAHSIAPNLSPEVRMNAFFRYWPRGRGKFCRASLLDPWHGWRIG